jgi:hypothetical protein
MEGYTIVFHTFLDTFCSCFLLLSHSFSRFSSLNSFVMHHEETATHTPSLKPWYSQAIFVYAGNTSDLCHHLPPSLTLLGTKKYSITSPTFIKVKYKPIQPTLRSNSASTSSPSSPICSAPVHDCQRDINMSSRQVPCAAGGLLLCVAYGWEWAAVLRWICIGF